MSKTIYGSIFNIWYKKPNWKEKKQTKSIDIKVFILDPCHCAIENKISDRNIYFVICKLDLIFYFHA